MKMNQCRNLAICILAIVVVFMLSACGCKHEWKDATCTTLKTCSLCGETEGDVVPHTWQDATCLAPQTCIVCNETAGSTLDHQWKAADCLICTVCGLDERIIDEKFLDSLVKGLEARWALTNADSEKTVFTKADLEAYFDAEYNQIIQYERESFENEELGKWAKKYISTIVQSKEALAYYGTNQWEAKYTRGIYNDRTQALYQLHIIKPIPVSSENQGNLLGLLNNGETIDFARTLFNQVTFTKKTWRTYEAVIENTSSINYSYFALDVDLIDKEGVTIATKTAWVDNWEPGEKIRFSFYATETFSEMKVEYASWNY